MAGAMRFGDGVAKDLDRAARLIAKACERGHAKACWLHALGDETPAGIALMEKACADGAAMACRARLFEMDDDDRAARPWAEKGCQAGDAFGCYWLADRERDLTKRLAAYDRACATPWLDYDLRLDGDDHARPSENKACEALARAYFDDRAGVSRTAGTRALEALCARDVPLACMFAGHRHFAGDGVPKSEARAIELTDRACALDDAGSCYLLGRRLAYDGRTEDDRARAVHYLTRACDLDDRSACDLLARVRR